MTALPISIVVRPRANRDEVHRGRLAALALCCLCAVFAFTATPARAVNNHAFDPVLSLRGDGLTDSSDEVPDPGASHPPAKFVTPCGTAVDSYGDIYVASPAIGTENGRIDVFNSSGEYLAEVKDAHGPCSLAVDSEGNIYATEFEGPNNMVRFEPEAYPPIPGVKYKPPVIVHEENTHGCGDARSVAVDPSNDHTYITCSGGIQEFKSASEGGELLNENIGADLGICEFGGIDVYAGDHDIYVAGVAKVNVCGGSVTTNPANQRILILNPTGTEVLHAIKGPKEGESFGFIGGKAPVAVDQSNGDVYVGDLSANHLIDQFTSGGAFIGQITYENFLTPPSGPTNGDVAVDAPFPGQSDYNSPNAGYVYVAQGEALSKSHLYAFKPQIITAPAVEAQLATGITEAEAVLRAQLNPGSKPTTYRFEYIAQAAYEAAGNQYGAGAISVPLPEASAGEGGSFAAVSQPISGLQPGTAYRFRLVASNCASEGEVGCRTLGEGKPGEEGKDAAFSTYRPEASLPDGRAYELVTPPDTNGRTPTMTELGANFNPSSFDTTFASPDGGSVVFGTEGGSIPGLGGGGFHDTYEAVRIPGVGWQSHFSGPSAAQAEKPTPGGLSPDHAYSFWDVYGTKGSLATGGSTEADYVRRPGSALDPACSPEPGGHFEFIGCGSLGVEPYARGKWISPGGSHIIFDVDTLRTGVIGAPLEPCAHKGISTVYDRTADGVTHCIVLPPDGASGGTTSEFESTPAHHQGTSSDGSAVVFELGGTLYVRLDNERTLEVAANNVDFAGISRDGSQVTYLKDPSGNQVRQGEVFFFNTVTEETTQVGSGGESTLVNVSADGSHAYFISPLALTGGEENDQQVKAKAGEANFYAWDGAALHFVALLDSSSDIEGREGVGGSDTRVGGLGLWTRYAIAANPNRERGPAVDPSRTTPDGSILVFESHAKLTAYENTGHSEVYRYEAGAEAGRRLICISCNPTGTAAKSDAQLESDTGLQFAQEPPVNALSQIANVTEDGSKVFFQTADPLVVNDTDGKVDVYEWEANGNGTCSLPAGCTYLISSGRSTGNDYLYSMTPNGSDVFFMSGDTLVPQDADKTPSIYDARAPHELGEQVGFAPPPPPPVACLGEACQPAPAVPADPTPASSTFEGAGNTPPARCRKGQHPVRKQGKTRCVKGSKHHHKSPGKHRRAHAKGRVSG
jgi:hypothetical protein